MGALLCRLAPRPRHAATNNLSERRNLNAEIENQSVEKQIDGYLMSRHLVYTLFPLPVPDFRVRISAFFYANCH